MKEFKFTLTYNESEEREEWETAKFQWRHGDVVRVYGHDFDDVIRVFMARYPRDLNEIHDCETAFDSDDGYVTYGNTEDGLGLRFDIEEV